MKKISLLFALFLSILSFTACSDNNTYADQLDRERESINAFIVKKGIRVISETEFNNQGKKTDVTKNEFVLFNNKGVYMQIVDEGTGEPLKKGEVATVLCRFSEYNLQTDTLQLTNNTLAYSGNVEKMSVRNTSGSFSAVFDASSSMMSTAYKSTAVPAGWLVAFPYVNIGRLSSATDKPAKVRLIVPSSQGQQYASKAVYACYYELTFMRGF